MSQENVESFKRATEAVNRRDVEAVLEEVDPDIEWHALFQVMFGGRATVCRGHEGVRQYLRELDEALSVLHVECSEFRDLGDRIVAIGRVRSRGRVSGAEIVGPGSFLAEFRNGRIFRMSDYPGSGALQAAGLRE
jgi:ketosteroid isomerase-like protein